MTRWVNVLCFSACPAALEGDDNLIVYTLAYSCRHECGMTRSEDRGCVKVSSAHLYCTLRSSIGANYKKWRRTQNGAALLRGAKGLWFGWVKVPYMSRLSTKNNNPTPTGSQRNFMLKVFSAILKTAPLSVNSSIILNTAGRHAPRKHTGGYLLPGHSRPNISRISQVETEHKNEWSTKKMFQRTAERSFERT